MISTIPRVEEEGREDLAVGLAAEQQHVAEKGVDVAEPPSEDEQLEGQADEVGGGW